MSCTRISVKCVQRTWRTLSRVCCTPPNEIKAWRRASSGDMPRAMFCSTSFSKWKRSSSSTLPSIFLLRNQDCNRSKNDMSFSRLFVSQRDQRIDARSPARGQKAGKRGDGTQNPGNGKEGDWIVRAHVEQLAG